MRYFFSTGEPSGELVAVLIAREISHLDPNARVQGIGAQRMTDAGIDLYADHTGWASMGPLAAIPRIPKLLTTMWNLARDLARDPPDLLVLVDFGAFNVRLASELREKHGYTGQILYIFPPGAWLDRPNLARRVAALCTPCPGYAHQRDFYDSLGLQTRYFGHPLSGEYALRPIREAPQKDSGTIAALPGSRKAEVRAHSWRLLRATRLLRVRRPKARVIFGAANHDVRREIEAAISRERLANIDVVDGANAALDLADAAWIASGTAVLEATLLGVPCASLYVLPRLLVRHARNVYPGKYITLPNLILEQPIIPELLQDHATPEMLASTIDDLLRNPTRTRSAMIELHKQLGQSDASHAIAAEAVKLAGIA